MRLLKRSSVLALCCTIMFLFVGCGTGPNTQDLSYIIEASYPKVVSIETFQTQNRQLVQVSAGSGVIVYAGANFSLVATNAHVVGDANGPYDSFNIIHWSNELYNGDVNPYSVSQMEKYTVRNISKNNVYYFSISEDLAIIKFTPKTDFLNYRASLRTSNLRVGEPVAAIGYSFGEFYRAAVGVVTQVFPNYTTTSEGGKNFEHAFMHDAITIFGNSGGPIFDAEGNLIGLTTMIVEMCTSGCSYQWPFVPHDCDVAAMGFSLAISSRHIADVMNNPNNSNWYIE